VRICDLVLGLPFSQALLANHQAYLVAKPTHMGPDVESLAYSLHLATTYNHETRGGVQSPRVWIFDVVLTVQVPERPALLHNLLSNLHTKVTKHAALPSKLSHIKPGRMLGRE
jgi:hypothetical protein